MGKNKDDTVQLSLELKRWERDAFVAKCKKNYIKHTRLLRGWILQYIGEKDETQ